MSGATAAPVDDPGHRTLSGVAMRILLVEDDEGDAFLVRELLLDAAPDIEIERVRTLAETRLVLGSGFDCVLLDLGLPDAQNLTALHAVLEDAPNLAVLVLTGHADETHGTQAVSYGAQDYLVKGTIDGELLRRAIRYAVERKRAEESVRRLSESELLAAEYGRLERGLLPQPVVSGHGATVVTRYTPGQHQSVLGGDFYDVVERADGVLFLVIGDVAGHGPDEAALGVCLRIAWRTLVLAGVDPETILPSMAAVLVTERGSDEVFATVAMVRVDLAEGIARFWLAGHPLPALISGTDVSTVSSEACGIALGVVESPRWPSSDIPVDRNMQLLLFTDGLVEGYVDASRSQRLGEDRMRSLLRDRLARGETGRGLVESLLHDVRERNGGELTDDVAILLVSWQAAVAPA